SELSDTPDYGGFHESAGDLVAIVSTLHFNSVGDHLLAHSKGNLFTPNELQRVGELSASWQIRVGFNNPRMSTIGNEPHDRSLPLTGAVFDVFVEVFQKELVRRELITQKLAERSQNPGRTTVDDSTSIQNAFASAYSGHEAGFKEALLVARDYL